MLDVVALLNIVNEYSLNHVKHYTELKLLTHPSGVVDDRSSGSSSLPSCGESSANEYGGGLQSINILIIVEMYLCGSITYMV